MWLISSWDSLLPLSVTVGVALYPFTSLELDSIDLQDKQVTVKAGTAMEELSDILDDYSLALAVFPTIGWQTSAGAIITATHGNGIKYENIAFLVVSLEMLTPM